MRPNRRIPSTPQICASPHPRGQESNYGGKLERAGGDFRFIS